MNRHRTFRSAVLLLATLAPAGMATFGFAQAAAGNGATQVLLEKANALEARGRMDMAAQTWQQVLLADPKNTEALAGLARAAKVSGNTALANTYIEKLRAINPNDPGIARAESVMTQTSQLSQLQKAGQLAQQGNYAQSMNIYRQVFGGSPPAGEWALAYYETEAATEDGRAHAVAGLRSLVDRYPQDSRYQVTLGRILTYNPQTRAEGRRLLARHPKDPQATEALKQSLVWDSQNPATTGEIRQYLQTHRDPELEAAVRQTEAQARASRASSPATSSSAGGGTRRGSRSSSATTPPAEVSAAVLERRQMDAEENAAYASLNAKRFGDAETRFQALLSRNPNDGRALAGLGYVRMNQQNFAEAIRLLSSAKENGARDAGIERNIAIATYYGTITEGGVALNENDLPTAEQKYQQALQLRANGPEALQGLAGTLLKAGQPEAAIPYFEALTRARSTSTDAWRGLFTAQYQAGQSASALATERRMPAAVRTQLMRDPDYLRTLSQAYMAVGRDADAQRVLRSALDLPFPPGAKGLKVETQLQYASLLLQANHIDQAQGLYRQVLTEDPENVLAWQGLVNAQHATHGDGNALATIESMPPGVYDQALRDPGFLATAASVYQANNKLDLAQSLLERSIAQSNTSGQKVPIPLQIQLAGLYLQRNDATKAYPIYQRVLSENPDRVDAWKGLLNALHTSGHDGDALSQVQQIPPAVRHQLEGDVEYLQVVGQIYNGLGDRREAQVFLARVQQHYSAQHTLPPADIDVQNAYLLYDSMNDAGLYRQLLYLGGRRDLGDDQRRQVQTIWANWAVRRANQASSANNVKRALAILNAAARSFPDNPGVLRALASGYLRAGLPKQAVLIFKSQDMSSATAADYKAAVGAALAANDPRDAEPWLRYGLNQYPKDGQLLQLAAKFEQARGDSGRAADYYRASLAATPALPGSELAYLLNSPMPLNPRALPTAQSADLAALLAPGAETPGAASAAAPPPPFLPSYGNVSGTAPVQVNPNTPLVPGYMRGNGAQTRSRLGDYVPPTNDYQPDGSYGMPQGSFNYPSPPSAIALPGGGGLSESEIPAEAQPRSAATAGTEVAQADTAPYLTEQQEAVRKASDAAVRAGAAALNPNGEGLTEASFGGHGEGAQTASFNGEVYGPYVPYIAPTTKGPEAVSYTASDVEVPETTIVTNFPTSRGKAVPMHTAKSTTTGGPVHHKQDEDAEAAEIRRHQSDPLPAGTAAPADEASSANISATQYSTVQRTQYGGVLQPAGQVSRAGLPATAPTNVIASFPSGGRTDNPALQGGTGNSYGQQYPQPFRQSQRAAVRRSRTRSAQPVGSFGVQSAPLFYPSVPSALSSQPYPDLPPYNSNPQQPPTDQDLLAKNIPPLRGGYSPITSGTFLAGPPLDERQQTELDLASLEASYSGWVGGNAFLRARSGTPGIDRLRDFETPFEFSAVLGKRARFTIVPRGVFLDSGSIDPNNIGTNTTPYLGTFPANGVNTPAPQYASGVGGELQMTTQNLGLAVGYTPYEFLVNNITARARWKILGGPITIFGERDSVKETQLSYAGLRDPGQLSLTQPSPIWGGVVSTGGGIRLDVGNERAGFFASADGATLTGYHVLDNRRYEGGAGAYFRVRQFPGYGALLVGGSLFGEHFDHNELALTYGLGGYFSPEIYLLGSVPVTFNGYYKTNLHYVIQGSVGVQTFQEDSGSLFPLDPGAQLSGTSSCTNLQLANKTCSSAFLPQTTNTGANFGVNAEVSYRIADHWYVGGALTANNTNNYNLVQPTLFVRYLFKQQYPTEDYPTGLFPTDGFRPLRVP